MLITQTTESEYICDGLIASLPSAFIRRAVNKYSMCERT